MNMHPSAHRAARILLASTLLAAGLGLSIAPEARAKSIAMAQATLYDGVSAGHAITLDRGDLRFGRVAAARPMVSFRQAWLRELGEPSGEDEQHDVSWKLLSVVGPLVSVETTADGFVTGAAHPYGYATITAYDVRRGGKPAKLTDYFAPRDILGALLGDGLVRKALGNRPAAAQPRTLEALLAVLADYQSDDCRYAFGTDLLSRFAFHHVAGGRVAVRFGLSHGCEVAHGNLTIMAIYLPIPAALRSDLAAAQTRRAGFLVPAAPKGVAQASLMRKKASGR